MAIDLTTADGVRRELRGANYLATERFIDGNYRHYFECSAYRSSIAWRCELVERLLSLAPWVPPSYCGTSPRPSTS